MDVIFPALTRWIADVTEELVPTSLDGKTLLGTRHHGTRIHIAMKLASNDASPSEIRPARDQSAEGEGIWQAASDPHPLLWRR